MEDLLTNYSSHIGRLISPYLGAQLSRVIQSNSLASDMETLKLEGQIRGEIEHFLQSLNENESFRVAQRIFSTFLEEDDRALIDGVRFLIRIYSYYEKRKVRRWVNKWKKVVIYLRNTN